MAVPTQIKYRLIHYKKQILLLAASKVLSVIAICQLLAILRNTFYKYRQQEKAGTLGTFNCAPHQHGRTKSVEVVEKVLAARKLFPHYGKRRLAGYLRAKGTQICANTTQKILRAHNQALPAEKRHHKHWRSFEAIKPNTIWSIDICYLYTEKKDGFDLYLITILDDHSRFVVASALFPQQTVVEVVAVLKQAVLSYGVPQFLVSDNGVQFTCSEFRRVCKAINLELDFAPKHYPQYKGKLERFFRTTRKESHRADNIESARRYHDEWIKDYNFNRVHSAVLDIYRHQHPPSFRFGWEISAAHSLPKEIDIDATFTVHNSIGSITRAVKADQSISYKKQRHFFHQLNKGDIIIIKIIIKELKDSTEFFFQDQLLLSRPKSALKSSTTRKVKRDGSGLVNHLRFPLGLPKDSQVIISRKGDSFLFFFNGCQIFPIPGQDSVQQPI